MLLLDEMTSWDLMKLKAGTKMRSIETVVQ